jgi:hypothetical protein
MTKDLNMTRNYKDSAVGSSHITELGVIGRLDRTMKQCEKHFEQRI